MKRFSLLLTFAFAASMVQASMIPSQMPQTRRVDSELWQLQSDLSSLDTQLDRLRSNVRGARGRVETAIRVSKTIRAMDRRVEKLIDQLKPYQSLPKVRTFARTLSKNLQRIHEQLHALRKKSDDCERDILVPLKRRLVSIEQTIAGGRDKIRGYRAGVGRWRSELVSLANQAARIPGASSGFDRCVGGIYPSIQSANQVLHTAARKSTETLRQINQLGGIFSAYNTVGSSLTRFETKIKPAEVTVGKLDKTLGKELKIKLPFSKKYVRFSVREILEKPGQIIGVVLKPFEALADKALQPVLKKMNLEIKPPVGLAELRRELDRVRSIQRAIDDASADLLDSAMSQLSTLASHYAATRRQLDKILQSARQTQRTAEETKRKLAEGEQSPPQTKPTKRREVVMFFQAG